jgi:adenosylcobinamide-GDP ribazoletransferase
MSNLRARPGRVISGTRLALGLLTVVPTGAVDVDRRTARDAMLLAPVVGLVLGAVAWAVGGVLHARGLGSLIAAVAAVATLSVATRALHLDGLADLADGLGSGRPAAGALEVMRRSDAGPFGVSTLVLVLLTQMAVLARAWELGLAGPALLIGCLTGRLALLWACRVGSPPARPDGLGALVAGVVPVPAAGLVTAVGVAAALAWGALDGSSYALGFGVSVIVGICAAALLQRLARRRLGGVTGDVLGALVETAMTAAMLTLLLVTA